MYPKFSVSTFSNNLTQNVSPAQSNTTLVDICWGKIRISLAKYNTWADTAEWNSHMHLKKCTKNKLEIHTKSEIFSYDSTKFSV